MDYPFLFHTTVNYHIHTFANILRCYIFFCYFTDEGTWKSTKNICTQHWWFHRGWAILQPDNIGPTSKGKGNTTTSFFDSFAWYSCNQKVIYCYRYLIHMIICGCPCVCLCVCLFPFFMMRKSAKIQIFKIKPYMIENSWQKWRMRFFMAKNQILFEIKLPSKRWYDKQTEFLLNF